MRKLPSLLFLVPALALADEVFLAGAGSISGHAIESDIGGTDNVDAGIDYRLRALEQAGVRFHLELSASPAHATELARQAVARRDSPIIVAGGDGTVNHVINGMLQVAGGESVPLGILPMGTANDLVHGLQAPTDLTKAAQLISAAQTRRIDVGQGNDRYFVNCSGLGLGAHISRIQSRRLPRAWGNLRYLIATLKGIVDRPSWHAHQWWVGQRRGIDQAALSLGRLLSNHDVVNPQRALLNHLSCGPKRQ